MKIALVTIHFHKNVGIGGPAYEIASRLAQNPASEIHVFTATASENLPQQVVCHKVPVVNGPYWLRAASFSVLSALWLHILRLKGLKFDLVHSLNRTLYKSDIVSCCGCDRAGLKQAEDFCRRNTVPLSGRLLFKYRLILPLLEYNFKPGRYSAMIATSAKVKRELSEFFGIPAGRINVIPQGVDPQRFHPAHRDSSRCEIRRKHSTDDGQFVFLFAGTPFLTKGFMNLLKAFSLIEHDPAVIWCIGDDPKGQRHATELLRRYDLQARVKFIPPVGNIEQYYGAADALVHPSYYDAFGLVIIEAMASGLPVIASRECGATDIIEHGTDGLILEDVTNEEELAAQMRLLLKEAGYRDRLGTAARQTALNYSWDKISQLIQGKYDDELSRTTGQDIPPFRKEGPGRI